MSTVFPFLSTVQDFWKQCQDFCKEWSGWQSGAFWIQLHPLKVYKLYERMGQGPPRCRPLSAGRLVCCPVYDIHRQLFESCDMLWPSGWTTTWLIFIVVALTELRSCRHGLLMIESILSIESAVTATAQQLFPLPGNYSKSWNPSCSAEVGTTKNTTWKKHVGIFLSELGGVMFHGLFIDFSKIFDDPCVHFHIDMICCAFCHVFDQGMASCQMFVACLCCKKN